MGREGGRRCCRPSDPKTPKHADLDITTLNYIFTLSRDLAVISSPETVTSSTREICPVGHTVAAKQLKSFNTLQVIGGSLAETNAVTTLGMESLFQDRNTHRYNMKSPFKVMFALFKLAN